MQMNRLEKADFDKMIIESIDEVYCYDQQTDDLLFFFDQIKNGEITSESDVVYAEGRQGVQLAAFDRNKTAGFTCENGYVQAGAIAVQLGSDLVNATDDAKVEYEVMETVAKAANASTYTISETPTELVGVYLIGSDGSTSRRLSPGVGEQGDDDYEAPEYTVAGKVITLDVDGTAPASVMVHYKAETATGKKIINAGDKFSKNIKLVINFVAQDPCGGNKYLMQCVMPNAKASGTFSLSAGDDPAVHNFEASALLSVCSEDKELFHIVMV